MKKALEAKKETRIALQNEYASLQNKLIQENRFYIEGNKLKDIFLASKEMSISESKILNDKKIQNETYKLKLQESTTEISALKLELQEAEDTKEKILKKISNVDSKASTELSAIKEQLREAKIENLCSIER